MDVDCYETVHARLPGIHVDIMLPFLGFVELYFVLAVEIYKFVEGTAPVVV